MDQRLGGTSWKSTPTWIRPVLQSSELHLSASLQTFREGHSGSYSILSGLAGESASPKSAGVCFRPIAAIEGLAENRLMKLGFTCPVCGFHDAKLPPFEDGQNNWYQEICPSCGTQFGYDDASLSHQALRLRWIENGAKWSSSAPAPIGFDGLLQLRAADPSTE